MRAYTHLEVREGTCLRVRLRDAFLPLNTQAPEALSMLVKEVRQLAAHGKPIGLDLSRSRLCGVSVDWVRDFVKALPDTLRAVDLSDNDFGAGGELFPCYHICGHRGLEAIYLGGNALGQ